MGSSETRRIWWISFVVVAGIGVLWSLSTPLLAAPDEDAHAVKAASVAFDGVWPVGMRLSVPPGYADAVPAKDCLRFHPGEPASCAPPLGDDVSTLTPAFTQAGPYPPLYYLLVAPPAHVLAPTPALYAMRCLSALVGAALLASAICSLAVAGSRRWLVIGLALAMTPMVFYLTGVLNPNGMEITAATGVWATLLALLRPGVAVTTTLLLRLGVAATVFAAARPLSPALLVATVAVVTLAAGDRRRLSDLARDTSVRITAAAIGIVVIASVAYVQVAHSLDALIPNLWPSPPSTGDLARAGIGELPGHAHQLVGVMGYNDNPLPWWLVVPWLTLGAALILAALVVGSWRERLALGSLTAFVVLSPTIMALVNGREHGLIWQGRYTLPLAVGAPLLAGWVLGRRVGGHAAAVGRVATAVAVFVAAGQLVAHLQSMTRYVVGLPHGLLDYLDGGPWRPPLDPWILLAAALVTSAAYGTLLVALGRPAGLAVLPPVTADPTGSQAGFSRSGRGGAPR